jgi:thiol-disulfide isomerase/thioredoxin
MKQALKQMRFFLALATIFLYGCSSPDTTTILTGNIKGWDNQKIIVMHSPVYVSDSIGYDTIYAEYGVFKYEKLFSEPTYMIIIPSIHISTTHNGEEKYPLSRSVKIFVEPGEHIDITGEYKDGIVGFTSKRSSKNISAQAKIDEKLKYLHYETDKIHDYFDEMMKKGKPDEKLIDSLSERYSSLMNEIAQEKIEFIKGNTKSMLSAFYLLSEQREDTLLKYYNILDEKIKNSKIAERLNTVVKAAERRVLLKKNSSNTQDGKIAPDFTLTSIDDKEYSLSQLKGKVVVIDFFGTWCYWCVKGLPEMKKYYSKYNNKNVEFIGIACRDKKESVIDLQKKENIKWVILMNGEDSKDIALMYGVQGFPTKIIIDKDGNIVQRFLGEGKDFYDKLDEIVAFSGQHIAETAPSKK